MVSFAQNVFTIIGFGAELFFVGTGVYIRRKVGEVGMNDFDKLKISEVPVDYDSPINVICQQIVQNMSDRMAKLDDEVGDLLVGTAIKFGFDVDREKLIAVLTQDRERYVHAFRQGYKKREEEIVRCKDCKYYIEPTEEEAGGCLIKAGYFPVSENWYCADGERKDDNDN